MHVLRDLRDVAHAELVNRLLHLGIIGIGGAELKGVGLLEEQEVLDAHRGFAGVVKSGRELGARIVGVGPGHARRKRGSGLREKWIVVVVVVLVGVGGFLRAWRRCGGLRRGRGCGRLRRGAAHPETQKNHGHRYTKGNRYSLHRFSSGDFFSNMACMILISALCELSASVAKLNKSPYWPAPGFLNKSCPMVSAPLWC